MNKIPILVLVLLLTACGANTTLQSALATPTNPLDPPPTLAPQVESFMNTALAPHGKIIANIGTPTPSPTVTPTPTQSPSPNLVPPFNPYDGEFAPKLGIYPVGPLTEETIEKASDYTVQKLPNNYYPATLFGKVRTVGKAALDFSYCPDNVMNLLLGKLNTADNDWGWRYLNSYPDGVNFSPGFRVTVFPLNTVRIIDSAFINAPGIQPQWFVRLDTMPCTATFLSNVDPATIPAYQLQHQSNLNYNGVTIPGLALMGKDAILPLASTQPVWIQALALVGVEAQPIP